ncbi:MAG: hypothetical protein L0027_01805 [Candidatus Rokubacteria bacterium]|nr:hypothetical protein [Candidatus Rokubacteria bacterium]
MAVEKRSRIGQVLRFEGVRGLAARAGRKLLDPLVRVRRLFFFEMDLTRPFPRVEPRAPLEMRVATREDLETFAGALAGLGVGRAEARRQMDAGDVCTLGLVRGELVHVAWVSFRSPWIDEIGVRLELGPGESCGYGAVTAPEWRGLGIQPAGALFRNACQRARGSTRHISWVWAGNLGNSPKKQDERGRWRTKTVWLIWTIGMRQPLLLGATQTGSPVLKKSPQDQ